MINVAEKLLAAVHRAGRPVTAEELFDAIWIAQFLPARPRPPATDSDLPGPAVADLEDQPAVAADPAAPQVSDPASPDPMPDDSASKTKPTTPDVPRFPLETAGANRTHERPAVAVRLPAGAPALRGREVLRALQSFRHRIGSRTRFEVDEEATVEQRATTRLPVVRIRPVRERGLSACLVLDDSACMSIWDDSVREWVQLIGRSEFRNVRLLKLDADGDAPLIHAWKERARAARSRRPPVGSDAVVLVLSDFCSRAWWNGSAFRLFAEWGRTTAIGLIGLMPESFWPRTAAGRFRFVKLVRSASGPMELLAAPPAAGDILPAASLAPRSLAGLSGLLGKPRREVVGGGFWIPETAPIAGPIADAPNAEERLRRFQSAASPEAVQLVELLCLFDRPTVRTLRLIRAAARLNASAVEDAEVILGGLLHGKRIERLGRTVWQYQFHDGVSALVRREASWGASEPKRFLDRFREYLLRRRDEANNVRAAVSLPGADSDLGGLGDEFLTVDAETLAALGPRAADLVALLRDAKKPRPIETEPKAQEPSPTRPERKIEPVVQVTSLVDEPIPSSRPAPNSDPRDVEGLLTEALNRIEDCFRRRAESLDLSGLGLATLPAEIGRLTALTTLFLSNNRLTALPSEIGQLTALTTLSLSYNQLRTLPPEFCQLMGLRTLSFSHNQLTILPREISQLLGLTTLTISNNQLKTFPREIGQLMELTALSLSDNQLTSLPPEIGRLVNLEKLFLESNALIELPSSLRNLTKLRELALHDNPTLGLPTELLGPRHTESGQPNPPTKPRDILDYYFARATQGGEPIREVRVMLVGRGRVGKTSLLRSLQGKTVHPDEVETPGINVERLELKCPQGSATAHVWDFGGQEFLHGTHQIFLSERSVYVIVLEGRDSKWETETDYWLRFIQSFGGDSPVLVVLNKFDMHPFSVDRHRLKERCPNIVAFVNTDAVTGRGISELRNLLVKTVGEMKDVWIQIPLKWNRVKKALQSAAENFVEYKDYVAMCQSHGVESAQEQESLANVLHYLGIALNFREHHRLRHTSVLNPAWLTEAIYSLIRFTEKKDSHGVLLADWLPAALPSKRYPADKLGFIIDLMTKFEIAFPLDEKSRWLIPELLAEEPPATFEQFFGDGVQRLRFSYPDALPPGLLPRFIVRTYEMSEAHPQWRWRSGVVLEWAGYQALVRLDRLERRTEVAVRNCPLPNQQSLFDIIRAHLMVLHGNVRVIEESEIEGHRNAWVKVGKLRLEEREGTAKIKEYISDHRQVVVEVSRALDQVESDAARKAAGPDPKRRVQLFICYAHVDEKHLRPFRQHLTLLSQQGYIQIWHDRNLVAGESWEIGISEELQKAEIVLLFYTTAARSSQFIQKTELPISLDRAAKGKCTLLWVPMERNDLLDNHPLEKRLKTHQCATFDAKKIYDFEPQRIGWMQVEESIRKAVEKRRRI